MIYSIICSQSSKILAQKNSLKKSQEFIKNIGGDKIAVCKQDKSMLLMSYKDNNFLVDNRYLYFLALGQDKALNI